MYTITQNNKTGFRYHTNYAVQNKLAYTPIGSDAIDFSTSINYDMIGASGDNSFACGIDVMATGIASSVFGKENKANGDFSSAYGLGTRALNIASSVFGKYNLGLSNTLLEVGIGTSKLTRANGLEVYANGNVIAPALVVDVNSSNKTLTNKEYVLAQIATVANTGPAGFSGLVEYQFTATQNQTDFIIPGVVVTASNLEVYSSSLRSRKTTYLVTNNGTDTTVSFITGKSLNTLVDIIVYI